MESRTVFEEICALCPLVSRAQAELQNKQKNKWENRMSTNLNDRAIVKLDPSRFEERGPLLIAGLASRYTASTLDDLPPLWQRFSVHIDRIPGQVGRAAYGVCSDMCNGTAASITCRVSRSPNLRRFRNNSAACTFRRRDTSYFLTENMFRDFATRSIRSGLSGFRSRATEPRALPLALRTSLNDTAKSLIHSSEWAMARSGYR